MQIADWALLISIIGDFIDDCGFEPPLYVIAIGSNGSVSVSRHSDCDVEQVCGHNVGPGMVSPISVTIIGSDGTGKSALIEIEAARGRMQ
jgi:hypothetical protein